jgi:hypothetical protein
LRRTDLDHRHDERSTALDRHEPLDHHNFTVLGGVDLQRGKCDDARFVRFVRDENRVGNRLPATCGNAHHPRMLAMQRLEDIGLLCRNVGERDLRICIGFNQTRFGSTNDLRRHRSN